MNEPKASRYHRLKRRSAVASVVASIAFLTALVTSGASVAVRDTATNIALAAGLSPASAPSLVVAIYIVLLALAHELVLFPFALFHGYILERRYGLSRQAGTSWLRDHAKAFAVGLVLALIAGSVAYFALRTWPDVWWVVTAGVFAVATIGLAHLAPILLLPLFYVFKPLERESLRDRLVTLARRANTRVLGVFEWRLGDKTSKANAALVGINGTRRILLSDTLLAEYSDDEIEVILAHELAHHVHGDIWKGVALEGALTLAGAFVADQVLRLAGPIAGLSGPADVAGLPLLLLAVGGLSLVFAPIANALSRRHERQADRYALDATRNADAFMSAMRRLAAQNLSEERPSRLVEVLFHTHPAIEDRIAAAREWAKGT